MKVKYDKETDVLLIQLSDANIIESDEVREGIILDFDGDGTLISIEILEASKKSHSLFNFEYELAGA